MASEFIEQLARDLEAALTPDDFDRAQRGCQAAVEELNAGALAESGATLACRAGCSLCCSLRVDVFAHEIFVIARFVRAHFSEAEIDRLLGDLAAHSARVRPLTPFQHATSNNPCALLRDGRCSVYEVRPLSCRRHHSTDFAACQFAYDHPADLDFPAAHVRELYHQASGTMQEVSVLYSEFAFDQTIYELGTALAEALRAPESWQRWLEAEQAFVEASITPAV